MCSTATQTADECAALWMNCSHARISPLLIVLSKLRGAERLKGGGPGVFAPALSALLCPRAEGRPVLGMTPAGGTGTTGTRGGGGGSFWKLDPDQCLEVKGWMCKRRRVGTHSYGCLVCGRLGTAKRHWALVGGPAVSVEGLVLPPSLPVPDPLDHHRCLLHQFSRHACQI